MRFLFNLCAISLSTATVTCISTSGITGDIETRDEADQESIAFEDISIGDLPPYENGPLPSLDNKSSLELFADVGDACSSNNGQSKHKMIRRQRRFCPARNGQVSPKPEAPETPKPRDPVGRKPKKRPISTTPSRSNYCPTSKKVDLRVPVCGLLEDESGFDFDGMQVVNADICMT